MRTLPPPSILFTALLFLALSPPRTTNHEQDPRRVVNAVERQDMQEDGAPLDPLRVSGRRRLGLRDPRRRATRRHSHDLQGGFRRGLYLSIGGLHSCITVKEGKQTRVKLRLTVAAFAFVSLKNGQVYADWPSCDP